MGASVVNIPSGDNSKIKVTSRRRRIPPRRREILIGIVFIVPGLLLAIGFKLIPLINGIRLSLYKTRGFEDPSYIGLGNYQRLLHDPVVQKSFLTSLFVVASLPIWIILPLILAVLIFQQSPGWKFFRASFFLPYTIAPIVVGIMFRQILAVNGPLNRFLRAIGLKSIAVEWLNGQRSALVALVAVAIWSFFGLGVLIYLAALSTIPSEIVEAARLDGVGYWRMLMQVILPMIKPTLGYWTVLCASGVLVWMFPLIYALTQGGPGFSTTMPEYLVFLTTFQFLDRGYGSAIGICLFIFVGAISSFTVRYMYNAGTRSEK
jgi:ABC-type sugar transport system permease subunit